ncbi:major facilitator super transporter protein [Tieghemiomyces parasiticus]|uniref:GPI ethanolamine phosphate transferase 2 n=1 Tax=Tieghemiomyces parasiticus TaxID=78921 RepID=A0A9W8DND4_9FUNG|nr:major facilitator super transporter protein [Tieghemiomyces parasiticus]
MRQFGLWLLLVALELTGLYLFTTGFFPYKRSLPGFATFPPSSTSTPRPPTATYDRLVLMVVDALRFDFVLDPSTSAMAYTQGLIRKDQARAYVARAAPPTVTMPCLKALTTGSTPNFLDAVLNIVEGDTSATLASADNVLWQFRHAAGKRLAFYGDDTWLRLFPNLFDRYEGTTSFFVTDTVEVDRNVTRHLPAELERDDWDVLILHYLGLDHIGHLEGPRSQRMAPKQHEMDQVVEQIHRSLLADDATRKARDPAALPSLFVLLGDHGMNNLGNHGGTSVGETSPALVFMGSPLDGPAAGDEEAPRLSHYAGTDTLPTYGIVNQVDLVPTLSVLFGTPIPRNNLGALIPALLTGRSVEDQAQAWQANADQILAVVRSNHPDFVATHPRWLANPANLPVADCDTITPPEAGLGLARLQCYYTRARHLTERGTAPDLALAAHHYAGLVRYAGAAMSASFSNYNLPRMLAGIAVLGLALGLALVPFLPTLTRIRTSRILGLFTVNLAGNPYWFPAWLFLLMVVTYMVTLLGTSYVEDEQYFWYWWQTNLLALQLVRILQAPAAAFPVAANRGWTAGRLGLQLVLWRLAQQWNDAGTRLRDIKDIRSLLGNQFDSVTAGLLLLTLMIVAAHQWQTLSPGRSYHAYVARAATAGLAVSVFGSHLLSQGPDGLVRAPAVYLAVAHWGATLATGSTFAQAAYALYGVSLLATVAWAYGARCRHPAERSRVYLVAGRSALATFTLLLVLLNRLSNAGLLLIFHLLLRLDTPIRNYTTTHQPVLPTAVSLLAITASFYNFGYSNSLATVDLSMAYTGVAAYQVGLVGLLTYVSNWSGPIFWSAAAALGPVEGQALTGQWAKTLAPPTQPRGESSVQGPLVPATPGVGSRLARRAVAVFTLGQVFALFFLTIVVTIQRRHLFIWSVFSPKFLFQVVWTVHFIFTLGGSLWLSGWLATTG